jgi:hypothetical protein
VDDLFISFDIPYYREINIIKFAKAAMPLKKN